MIYSIKHKIYIYLLKNKKLNGRFYKILNSLNMFCFHYKRGSERKKFGQQNPDKTFYIIRPNGIQAGLMSLYWKAIEDCDYALGKGYYPIIDMKNYKTQYYLGKNENIWDIFFLQPTSYSLEEVYKSKNVIVQGEFETKEVKEIKERKDNIGIYKYKYDENSNKRKRMFIKKYLDINDNIKNMAEEYGKDICSLSCIGVFLRGTDYTNIKPKNHYIQPEIEAVIEKIDEFLEKYKVDKIFLVTEDFAIKEKFTKYYKKKMYPDIGKTIKNYDNRDFLFQYIPEKEKIDNAKLYLVKLLLLAKCDYFITSITNGSIFSLAYSEGFKDCFIFNLGVYK